MTAVQDYPQTAFEDVHLLRDDLQESISQWRHAVDELAQCKFQLDALLAPFLPGTYRCGRYRIVIKPGKARVTIKVLENTP